LEIEITAADGKATKVPVNSRPDRGRNRVLQERWHFALCAAATLLWRNR